MTYYELILLLSIPTILIVGLICSLKEHTPDYLVFSCLVTGLILFLGGLTSRINEATTPYRKTAVKETIPLSVNLTNDGLDVVTKNHVLYSFTSYKDIAEWKNGGKFYMVYEFKKVLLGSDKEKETLVISTQTL